MAKDLFSPKIKDQLTPYTEIIDDEDKVYDTLFKNISLSSINYIAFDGCQFENIIFNQKYNIDSFIDCVFINCDFSNSDLKSSYFQRCRFTQCKGYGTNFMKSKFAYTSFSNCIFSFANFSESIFDHVKLNDSEFSHSSFVYCKQNDFITQNIDFSDSDFSATSLDGCDFSTNELNGLLVSTDLIKGLSINNQQAISFAKLLGLIIN